MSEAARRARNPADGWVFPSLTDEIVNAARDGMTLAAIARIYSCADQYVLGVIARSCAYGFLSSEEAAAYGVQVEELAEP
jgi:hypothetical protein